VKTAAEIGRSEEIVLPPTPAPKDLIRSPHVSLLLVILSTGGRGVLQ